jgi:hypothetical protein
LRRLADPPTKKALTFTQWLLLAASISQATALGFFPASAQAGKCSVAIMQLLEEVRAKYPDHLEGAARSSESADSRLKRFHGSAAPGPNYSGHEGVVHTSPGDPHHAVKVWKGETRELFTDAVDFLVLADKTIAAIPEVTMNFRVVKVLERGDHWIYREFVKDSMPLEEAIRVNAAAKTAYDRAVKLINTQASRTKSPVLKRIRSMLMTQPPSINLHWDIKAQQIVLIDGF